MTKETQGERMARLEQKTDGIKDEITRMREDLTVDINKLNSSVKSLSNDLDTKYSAKWVEKVMSTLIGIILVAVVGALISLVIIRG